MWAKSGLVLMKSLNDRTELTLPDAETNHPSRLGPILPLMAF